LLFSIVASPVDAGNGIVTVNQHQTLEDDLCNQSSSSPWNWGSCNNNETLPFQNIAQASVPVDAFAYHVHAYQGLYPKQGQFCQAICDYQWAARPKIVSTDAGPAAAASVAQWLEVVCDDATRDALPGKPGAYRGRLHLEHWEDDLSLVRTNGDCLGGYNDWGGGANGGQAIANLFAGVSTECRAAATTIPNGLIYRPANTDRLKWSTTKSNEEITLLGFGHMGAVAMGDRLTLPNYTRDMRWKGINFTRVWAIEQWVGDSPNNCTASGKGPTPFPGTLANNNFNLEGANKNFYKYLRRFVQSAADHGIVVQLSVFDRHGIVAPGAGRGGFDSSPYNRIHNTEDDLTGRFPNPPACIAQGEGSHLEDPELAPCVPPAGFILPGANADFHFPYLARVARETGAIGNVMYEVINEAVQGSWPGGDGEDWQIEMAEFLKQNLPVSVVRDSFNEFLSGVPDNPLTGKAPDARQGGGDTWDASNAAVANEVPEEHTGLLMGRAFPLTAGAAMSGSLPFAQPALWTDLGVRATVTAASTDVRVGVGTSAGHHVRLEVRGPENKIRVVRVGSGGLAETLLGEVTLANAASEKTVRLRILKDSQGDLSTEVIVDGEILPGLSVPVGELSGAFTTTFFSTNTYFGAAPSVDTFEAAFFCDSPSICGGGFEGF